MAKLKAFREAHNMTLAQMAEFLSLNPRTGARTVQRYEIGEQIPNRRMMVRIFEATDGAVKPDDFYDLPKSGEAA